MSTCKAEPKHFGIKITLKRWGAPSPDGRHLAILGGTQDSNVWMLENF